MAALLLEVRRMRAAGALFCDDGHRGWSDSSQTKSAVFQVLSCADSGPLRRQCNATKLRPWVSVELRPFFYWFRRESG